MKVKLAPHAGFCNGVKHALKLALEAAQQGEHVYTLGPLVHNGAVVDFLTKQGIKVIHSPEEVESGTILIRTHGVTPEVLSKLNSKNIKVIDATCSFVRKVQLLAQKLKERGYIILICGDRTHPEVEGLLGWAGGDALVIPEELDKIEKLLKEQEKVALISQTTQRESVFSAVSEQVKEVLPQVQVHKTICKATTLRQKAAAALAEEVDLMVVVGGEQSSNTRKLAQVCQEKVETWLIADVNDLPAKLPSHIKLIGVTAGASTPDWTIKEVFEKMDEEKFEETKNEETAPYPGHKIEVGKVLPGKVAQVTEDEAYVDIGYKTEAILPKGEFYLEEGQTLQDCLSVDDDINVLVLKINEDDDKVIVSQRRLCKEKRWQELEDAFQNSITIQGKVKEIVPAGIIIDLKYGIEGFMPGSLVDIRYIPDFEQFAGEELSFKIIELNRERDKVILSRKQVQEEENEKKKAETLSSLQVDDIIKGTVKRLTDFGAFVDVGGIDGLVHISELSWQRVEHPSDVLSVGDEIEVKVLEIIPERERISLSLRKAQPDPWTKVPDMFTIGEIVEGKITRIVNFGAFLELIPGVEGLVHISQMADYHVKHASEIISEGDRVKVKILDINPDAKRISLSIKAAQSVLKNGEKKQMQQQESNGSNVTLGDVFGDLFDK